VLRTFASHHLSPSLQQHTRRRTRLPGRARSRPALAPRAHSTPQQSAAQPARRHAGQRGCPWWNSIGTQPGRRAAPGAGPAGGGTSNRPSRPPVPPDSAGSCTPQHAAATAVPPPQRRPQLASANRRRRRVRRNWPIRVSWPQQLPSARQAGARVVLAAPATSPRGGQRRQPAAPAAVAVAPISIAAQGAILNGAPRLKAAPVGAPVLHSAAGAPPGLSRSSPTTIGPPAPGLESRRCQHI
jgi:hypothetical protein